MDTENYIDILVKSSSDNPYTVRFYFDEDAISTFCSCPAGEHRKLCKHIMRIINGDDSILFDIKQKKLLAKIVLNLRKTDIPSLLSKLNESEILLENAKQNAKKAKKNLEKMILHK